MNCIFLRRGYGTSGDGVNYVEYIESSGTQYIDTGFVPNNNTRVLMEVEAAATSSTSTSQYMLGSRSSSSSNQFALQTLSSNYAGRYGTQTGTIVSGSISGKYTVDMNKNVHTINGQSYTFTAETFNCPVSLTLFAMNNNGTNGYSPHSSMKLYSCKIYDNGTLIRDFYPALDTDGIACLYDKVSKTYYYNGGSGTFLTGASTGGGGSTTEYSVSISGSFTYADTKVLIGGSEYRSATTVKIQPGTQITVQCGAYSKTYGAGMKIVLDGTQVAKGNSNIASISYAFVPSSNCTIVFATYGSVPSGAPAGNTATITTS